MLPISPAVSLQGRSLTVVAAEQAHIATALAVANARPCRADCTALRLSRVRLGAQLDALTTEASEVTRQEVGADRQAAHLDEVFARREALRDDPVTARLTTLLGVTAAQIDLLSGLLFAGILEGIACLFWFVALWERDVPVVLVVTPPKRRPVTTGNGGIVSDQTSASQPVTSPPHQNASESELTRLAQDIAAGRVRATVADIRRHLGCSQARAASLRRQISESVTTG
jgi:hypothetical protein